MYIFSKLLSYISEANIPNFLPPGRNFSLRHLKLGIKISTEKAANNAAIT